MCPSWIWIGRELQWGQRIQHDQARDRGAVGGITWEEQEDNKDGNGR